MFKIKRKKKTIFFLCLTKSKQKKLNRKQRRSYAELNRLKTT